MTRNDHVQTVKAVCNLGSSDSVICRHTHMRIHVYRALLNEKKGKKGTEKKETRKEIHQTTTQSTDLNTELQQLRKTGQ